MRGKWWNGSCVRHFHLFVCLDRGMAVGINVPADWALNTNN